MSDMVNHPPHYTQGRFEAIDVIEDAVSRAPDPVLGGLQWQALKYLLRLWDKEAPAQDAAKARWYLDRLISALEE
ncbi:SaV-like [uncultured Caudovirales phage]|uniref:SaV-like n=1 Tax=uncultured Caudovirales phage TaxID=2100421 RepID=A0A6J5LZ29_9CAUD|nr:SaV-like [uncultured Caudovirales phage]